MKHIKIICVMWGFAAALAVVRVIDSASEARPAAPSLQASGAPMRPRAAGLSRSFKVIEKDDSSYSDEEVMDFSWEPGEYGVLPHQTVEGRLLDLEFRVMELERK